MLCLPVDYYSLPLQIMMSEREAELVDLPQEEQRSRPSICSPKLIILTVLASYFVSQNIYNYVMHPPAEPTTPMPEVDEWANFWELFERFKGYVVVSVVGFIVFYFLRQANDRHEEREFERIKKEEEEREERVRKVQAEREERIIRKMEEEERMAVEKQMRMAQGNTAESSNGESRDAGRPKEE